MLFASIPDGTVTIAEDFIESAVQGRKKGDAILRGDVEDGKITEEQYAEITGYPYD